MKQKKTEEKSVRKIAPFLVLLFLTAYPWPVIETSAWTNYPNFQKHRFYLAPKIQNLGK